MATSDSGTVAAWVAFAVAAFALLIALAQVAQQYLATAQSIRKCDRFVWGPMPGSPGRREWIWHQLRFRIVFDMPNIFIPPDYWHVPGSARHFAKERTTDLPFPFDDASTQQDLEADFKHCAEACWVTFARQISHICPTAVCVGLMRGDVDRIPSDLCVVPMQVSLRDVIAFGLMIGMTISSRYPDSIEMSGPSGSMISSNHPLLGKLVHFSASSTLPPSILRGPRKGDISRSWLHRLKGVAMVAQRSFPEAKRRYYEQLGLQWREHRRRFLQHISPSAAFSPEAATAPEQRPLVFIDMANQEHLVPISQCGSWQEMRRVLETQQIATPPYIILGPENKRIAPRSWKTLMKVVRQGHLNIVFKIAAGDYLDEDETQNPTNLASPIQDRRIDRQGDNRGETIRKIPQEIVLSHGNLRSVSAEHSQEPDLGVLTSNASDVNLSLRSEIKINEETILAENTMSDRSNSPDRESAHTVNLHFSVQEQESEVGQPSLASSVSGETESIAHSEFERGPFQPGRHGADAPSSGTGHSNVHINITHISRPPSPSTWSNDEVHEIETPGSAFVSPIYSIIQPTVSSPGDSSTSGDSVRIASPIDVVSGGRGSFLSVQTDAAVASFEYPGTPRPPLQQDPERPDHHHGGGAPPFPPFRYQPVMYPVVPSIAGPPKLTFFWACQVDIELGPWATPWAHGSLFPQSVTAMDLLVDICMAGLNVLLQGTTSTSAATTPIRHVNFPSDGDVILNDLWVHLRNGGHTWPAYAVNARGGTTAPMPHRRLTFPGFPDEEPLPALVLLSSLRQRSDLSDHPDRRSSQHTSRDRILELASLDHWLSHAAATRSIADGVTNLVSTTAGIVEELWTFFCGPILHTAAMKHGSDGGDYHTNEIAGQIKAFLNAELQGSAEQVVVWVALLRATKVMQCIWEGPSTLTHVHLFDDDSTVYLV